MDFDLLDTTHELAERPSKTCHQRRTAWNPKPCTDSNVLVRIRHVFEPPWPVPHVLVRLIVGEYFVNGVARRTLRRIGELAEARSHLLRFSKEA